MASPLRNPWRQGSCRPSSCRRAPSHSCTRSSGFRSTGRTSPCWSSPFEYPRRMFSRTRASSSSWTPTFCCTSWSAISAKLKKKKRRKTSRRYKFLYRINPPLTRKKSQVEPWDNVPYCTSVCEARSSGELIGATILSTVRKAARLAVYEEIRIRVKNHHTLPTIRPDIDLLWFFFLSFFNYSRTRD